MTRYKNRVADNTDLMPRFESKPSAEHAYNAISAIQRLGELGAEFWDDDPDRSHRWTRACHCLQKIINDLGRRRHGEQQDLSTALREFFQEFEHSTERMNQMLHGGTSNGILGDQRRKFTDWVNLTYRFCTYAITSAWIDDKKEETTISIGANLTTGEWTDKWQTEKMKVPKKYRRSTKKI